MKWILAFRHLLVRPGRSALLLLGYALGVAVMIVLLSIGDAMLEQSRDVALVGGGEVLVLPEGVDVEALRTGGMTGMFFGIDRARFVARQMIGGPRLASVVRDVSPLIDNKLVELRLRDTVIIARASAELPDAARGAGSAARIVAGTWTNSSADNAWRSPTAQQLYDEMDHFHLPVSRDTTWGEWHYFNVVVAPGDWWYITLLVGGDVRGSRWGGRVWLTHRLPDGTHRRFEQSAAATNVRFDTSAADLTIGDATVRQRNGEYEVRARAGAASVSFTLVPRSRMYFPPVELRDDILASGYAVPGLSATVAGTLCDGSRCARVRGARGYHDHNWGVWRGVTWEWGAGQGATHALLYGGVIADDGTAHGVSPFFLTLADSSGIQQTYRFARVETFGSLDNARLAAPESLAIRAVHGRDSVTVAVKISAAAASTSRTAGSGRVFVQMCGAWVLRGTAAGAVIADTGSGFFETWLQRR